MVGSVPDQTLSFLTSSDWLSCTDDDGKDKAFFEVVLVHLDGFLHAVEGMKKIQNRYYKQKDLYKARIVVKEDR